MRNLKKFKFISKAQTLTFLSKNKIPVPNTFYFSVKEWKLDKNHILNKIQKQFKFYPKLAIRSSSMSEDSTENSLAGAFDSYLNINTSNITLLKKTISKVIFAYDNNDKNQVLIQNMIERVIMSGVLMTKVHADGSPYYVINFDDISGKTDTITSGNAAINKTVYVYNGFKNNDFDNELLLKLLKLIKKIEKLFLKLPLDIEFAIDKNEDIYILQARPITTKSKWLKYANNLVAKRLPNLKIFINELMKRRSYIFGNKTLLGIMPDWNPAEMIGVVPNKLALSLYRELITKDVWSKAREKMGYRKLPKIELMVSFFGRPYIDVRNSINSFLPEDLNSKISEKLVNAYINKLENEPYLHDKLEFDVVYTIYNFNFKDSFKKRYPNLLTNNELNIYKNSLLKITKKAISLDDNSSFNFALKKINKLIELQKKDLYKKNTSQLLVSDHINTLIYECKKYGTLSFAIAARHGFIAEVLMKSLIDLNLISLKRISLFKKSVKTISTDLAKDFYNVCENKSEIKNFLNKYGHLRPSSYDILSPTYNDREYLFNGTPNQIKSNHKFFLTKKEKEKINLLLKDNDFENIDAKFLFKYFKKAIQAREYYKFIFTKHLSNILELIKSWGKLIGFNKDELSNFSIEDIRNLLFDPLKDNIKEFYKKKIDQGQKDIQVANSLKLNYLIRSERDIFIAPVQRSQANFIGDKIIEGEIIFLKADMKSAPNIKDKIVCIEGADPGYDWIFSRKIKGLITKFGGVNSHMSIRCAEYELPAAIGCGEQPFEKAVNSKRVILNCKSKQIESINL
tara:strand:+ start:768 stop:3155 length:2388 start_codon:yes stop_codon:yes gene_type:complete